jgi:hypothetical protein
VLLLSTAEYAEALETNTKQSYSRFPVYFLPLLLLLEIQSASHSLPHVTHLGDENLIENVGPPLEYMTWSYCLPVGGDFPLPYP